MIERQNIIDTFPAVVVTHPSLYDLAKMFWTHELPALLNVATWPDVLDVNLDIFEPAGRLGGLMSFMPAEMASAFIPAWIVIALEEPYPYGGFAPALLGALDPNITDEEDRDRFEKIHSSFNGAQRQMLASVILEISDLYFRKYPDVQGELRLMANFWGGEAPGELRL